MRLIQTFWSNSSQNEEPLSLNAGWSFPEYNWMSWALNVLLLRRYYDEIELYTDEVGKIILVDQLQLPYTKVHIIFKSDFKINHQLFALAKIKTYSIQEEPFLHIDGDIFLWNPLPKSLMQSELIASNPEINLPYNKEILDEMEEHVEFVPPHLKNVNIKEDIFSSNAGIFGGTNISFIKKYCKQAEEIIAKNANCLHNVNTGRLNMLIEQISLFYLAEQEGITISYYLPKPVDHPLYLDYWRFADVPNVPMIHPVGGCKQISYVMNHLARRLQLEFPETYYSILNLYRSKNIELNLKFYNHIEIKDKKSVQDSLLGKGGKNIKNINKLKGSFSDNFIRTLFCLKPYAHEKIDNPKELLSRIEANDVPYSLKEIFTLELNRVSCFEHLLNKIEKDDLYNVESRHYKKISSFSMDSNWTEKIFALKEEVKFLKLERNWSLLNEDNFKDIIEHDPETSYVVTLSFDLLNLLIHESFHDNLGAILIEYLQAPKSALNILNYAKTHFEEDIDVKNPKYQQLIFDILKRFAFENILSIS
jgi:hypothetical protein